MDAAKLLQRVPRALLLLLKTNDCLRSVDASLGQARVLGSVFNQCACALWTPHWGRQGAVWQGCLCLRLRLRASDWRLL